MKLERIFFSSSLRELLQKIFCTLLHFFLKKKRHYSIFTSVLLKTITPFFIVFHKCDYVFLACCTPLSLYSYCVQIKSSFLCPASALLFCSFFFIPCLLGHATLRIHTTARYLLVFKLTYYTSSFPFFCLPIYSIRTGSLQC